MQLHSPGMENGVLAKLPTSYLGSAVFWLVVWAIVFYCRPRQRRVMLWTGGLLAITGPVSEYWALKDYWHPEYFAPISFWGLRFGGLEDLFLQFALAGICAGVFEMSAERLGWAPLPEINRHVVLRLCGVLLLAGFGFSLVPRFTGWVSIHVLLFVVSLTTLVLLIAHPSYSPSRSHWRQQQVWFTGCSTADPCRHFR